MREYKIRPRNDHRGVDLISDVLLFGRLWYGEPNASDFVIKKLSPHTPTQIFSQINVQRHMATCA
jgi:hypothetical protein